MELKENINVRNLRNSQNVSLTQNYNSGRVDAYAYVHMYSYVIKQLMFFFSE